MPRLWFPGQPPPAAPPPKPPSISHATSIFEFAAESQDTFGFGFPLSQEPAPAPPPPLAPKPAPPPKPPPRETRIPPYAQLHQRLHWITTLTHGAIIGAFSKAEVLAMLRIHSIFLKASSTKDDCALELLRLINAGGLSKPENVVEPSPAPTAPTAPKAPAPGWGRAP